MGAATLADSSVRVDFGEGKPRGAVLTGPNADNFYSEHENLRPGGA